MIRFDPIFWEALLKKVDAPVVYTKVIPNDTFTLIQQLNRIGEPNPSGMDEKQAAIYSGLTWSRRIGWYVPGSCVDLGEELWKDLCSIWEATKPAYENAEYDILKRYIITGFDREKTLSLCALASRFGTVFTGDTPWVAFWSAFESWNYQSYRKHRLGQ